MRPQDVELELVHVVDDEGAVEMFDATYEHVDAVKGPAHAMKFVVLKAGFFGAPDKEALDQVRGRSETGVVTEIQHHAYRGGYGADGGLGVVETADGRRLAFIEDAGQRFRSGDRVTFVPAPGLPRCAIRVKAAAP